MEEVGRANLFNIAPMLYLHIINIKLKVEELARLCNIRSGVTNTTLFE